MTDPSLRHYLQLKMPVTVREFCAPGMRTKTISLRSLMTSLRIIHVSDFHFTDSAHTWDVGGPLGIRRDSPDNAGRQAVADFLIDPQVRERFGTNIVIITGDITDGGGDKDYPIAREFITKLGNAQPPFQVYVVPGNHDYCWEGNLFFQDLFAAIKVIDTTAEVATLGAAVTAALPTFLVDPSGATFTATITGAIAAAELAVFESIKATIRAGLTPLQIAVPGLLIPEEFVDALALLFTVTANASTAGVNIVIGMTDTVDNETRRQRFSQFITPGNPSKYPHHVVLDGGHLILLDSMQDELDQVDGQRSLLAQGRLGKNQRDRLTAMLSQFNRRDGKRVVVCLHHSPFKKDGAGALEDADSFLRIVSNNVDCLLFGHTTPDNEGIFNEPSFRTDDPISELIVEQEQATKDGGVGISLINCENLEHVPDRNSYPITVLDLGACLRAVFKTDGSEPQISWGTPHESA